MDTVQDCPVSVCVTVSRELFQHHASGCILSDVGAKVA